eukprot:8899967-Pyramimonas_sp.AAC.1
MYTERERERARERERRRRNQRRKTNLQPRSINNDARHPPSTLPAHRPLQNLTFIAGNGAIGHIRLKFRDRVTFKGPGTPTSSINVTVAP